MLPGGDVISKSVEERGGPFHRSVFKAALMDNAGFGYRPEIILLPALEHYCQITDVRGDCNACTPSISERSQKK